MKKVLFEPASSRPSGAHVRRRRAAARLSAAGVALAGAIACALPPDPPRLAGMQLDSLVEAEARAQGAEWRALHYPAADLHGPFARPVLADTAADPNDAVSYYRLGDSVRLRLPGLADRAFYWALRLDPSMAEAYFARWDLRRRRSPWREFQDRVLRRTDERLPNERAALDSLLFSGLAYNPFGDGSLEMSAWVLHLDEQLAAGEAVRTGMRAYERHNYRRAVDDWGKVLRKEPRAVWLRVPRAYAWVRLGESDSAITDLTALANRIERSERESTRLPYTSKYFLYYTIGILQAGRKRYPEARVAYEQALVDNLGFYMAHVRLSAAAMLMHDTTTAINELATATFIRGDDPVALVYYGSVLIGVGQLDEAERQLRASLSADSDYALPRAFLGVLAEERHDTVAARDAYRDYLSRASRSAPERSWATERLARLTSP
jgi:tetratricopeptide (TPR) repeat protein